jgi:MGT family glycosyltransferase
MASVMIVVPPLSGHVNPTIAVGAELAARGHQVTWAGYDDFLTDRLPTAADHVAVNPALPPAITETVAAQTTALRGMAALRFLWDGFILPVARDMLPGLRRAVADLRPDLLLVDQQAIAGAAVAEAHGLPWVTSATTTGELSNPASDMPAVEQWRRAMVEQFLVDAGVGPERAGTLDPRYSDRLVLHFSTRLLVGSDRSFPDHYAFVGAALEHRPAPNDFPFDRLDPDRRLVLVSLGSVNGHIGERFFRAAADALGERDDLQGVIVADPDLVPEVPDNVVVRPWVPQLSLVARASALVSHGGQNTVSEALSHAVPMVLAPIRDDQPTIADQVVAAGAGIRIKFGRAGAPQISAALAGVLDDPGYADAAQRLRASYAEAGGATEAVRRIEELL